jgi:hypothetical protein
MTNALPLSSRIYGRLLLFYPEELRRAYGEEMALVFADELREADFGGAARIWRNALTEFLQLALPAFVSRPAFRVPALACAVGLVSLSAASLSAALEMRAAPIPLQDVCFAISPLSNLPIIALMCMWACRGRGVTSLHLFLRVPEEPEPCSKCAI